MRKRCVQLNGLYQKSFILYSNAYGSAIGNVITLVSISVAIVRYDVLGRKKRIKRWQVDEA